MLNGVMSNRDIDFSTRIINLVASNVNLNKYIEIDEINIKHSDYIKLILHNVLKSEFLVYF